MLNGNHPPLDMGKDSSHRLSPCDLTSLPPCGQPDSGLAMNEIFLAVNSCRRLHAVHSRRR